VIFIGEGTGAENIKAWLRSPLVFRPSVETLWLLSGLLVNSS